MTTNVLGKEVSLNKEDMTPNRESPRDPARAFLLTPSRVAYIGTWNVRTMYESGKAQTIAREMKRYNITLLGIAETQWIQSGKTKLTTGELILYWGHEEEKAAHTEGVDFMMSREAQRALISWEPIRSRLITNPAEIKDIQPTQTDKSEIQHPVLTGWSHLPDLQGYLEESIPGAGGPIYIRHWRKLGTGKISVERNMSRSPR